MSENVFLVLSGSLLLCFGNQDSYQHINQHPDCQPDMSIDLSNCTLSWAKKRKTNKDTQQLSLAVKSDLVQIHDIIFTFESGCVAQNWFEALQKHVKRVKVGSSSQETFVRSNSRDSASPSLPDTESLVSVEDISQPRDVHKASIQEISANLAVPNVTYSSRKPGAVNRILSSFRRLAPKRVLKRISYQHRVNLERMLEGDRHFSRRRLEERGIYRHEPVFGNHLLCLPQHPGSNVPLFVYRCIHAIEAQCQEIGLYRINGDSAKVQKLRLDIDRDNYSVFKEAKPDTSLLCSALKLFFRELPDPLISKEVMSKLHVLSHQNEAAFPDAARKELFNQESYDVLGFLMLHLKRVADEPKNQMDAMNLAIVFSPNLVHIPAEAMTPQSIMLDIRIGKEVTELLIRHAKHIFI